MKKKILGIFSLVEIITKFRGLTMWEERGERQFITHENSENLVVRISLIKTKCHRFLFLSRRYSSSCLLSAAFVQVDGNNPIKTHLHLFFPSLVAERESSSKALSFNICRNYIARVYLFGAKKKSQNKEKKNQRPRGLSAGNRITLCFYDSNFLFTFDLSFYRLVNRIIAGDVKKKSMMLWYYL